MTIALTLAVMLVAPGAAVARRIVTGSAKTAIIRTVPTALPTPQRCLVVYVTTKDGGNWATMGFNNAMLHSCIRWAANGVAIAHRVNGHWYLSRVGPGAPGYGDAVNLQSIDHVHWAHWGAATATGQGNIVSCGTGCATVRATMTVYGLTTSQLAGGKAYTWLRVSFTASYPTTHTTAVTYNVRPVPEHAF